MKRILGVLSILLSATVSAHTWDEPWHKEVVTKSETFGLYEVLINSGSSLELKLIQHLAGEETKSKIRVSRYYLFEGAPLVSEVDDHPFYYKKGQKIYAFLTKEGGEFSVATPTAGIDELMPGGSVAATYRHSLHRAKANVKDYELLQTCIFNYLHGQNCPPESIGFITAALKEPVAVLSETVSAEEADRFFLQHGALETAYLISMKLDSEILDPFLESGFFHVQISAVRALSVSDISDREEKLVSYVKSGEKAGVARVMAVILLKKSPSRNTVDLLRQYAKDAPEDEVYLGGDIMDPRVGTWYPESVKAAIEWFLSDSSLLDRSGKSGAVAGMR